MFSDCSPWPSHALILAEQPERLPDRDSSCPAGAEQNHKMKRYQSIAVGTLVAALCLGGGLAWQSQAADAGKDAIKEVMKAYHKAPKGVDPVCKKAADGKATPDELKKLVVGYKVMVGAKAPRGDEASWKE